MALQSQLFRGDAKLEAASISDNAHIVRGTSGPHVSKIQQALIQLDAAAITADGAYGSGTAAAVSAFKRKRQILNFQSKIDDIVGKKTIAALDTEMLAKEKGGGGTRGVVRRGVNTVGDATPGIDRDKPLDIIVQFAGALGKTEGTTDDGSRDDFANKFNTPAYLQTHQPVAPVCFFGGRGSNDRSGAAAALVVGLRLLSKNGITVVLGESSGGLPALKAAEALTKLGVKLAYVGIADGAFFQTLGEVIPFSNFPPQLAFPLGIDATKKENFFQSFGHNTLKDPRGPGGFMLGTEFHIAIKNGFRDIDMEKESRSLTGIKNDFIRLPFASSLPLAIRKFLFADPAHVAAGRAAEQLTAIEVTKLIKA